LDPDWDPHGFSLISVSWTRIQVGKKNPQEEKEKTVRECTVLKCWMFSFEGGRLLL